MPKSNTPDIPREYARLASSTACFIESWKMPGIEGMGFLTSSPAITKIGYMKSLGESSVSRTRPRRPPVRRVLRSLWAGNGISTVLSHRWRSGLGRRREQLRHGFHEPEDSGLRGLGVYPDAEAA